MKTNKEGEKFDLLYHKINISQFNHTGKNPDNYGIMLCYASTFEKILL
jgi:hypothetical protein